MFNNHKFDKDHLEEVLIKPSNLDMGVPKSSAKITSFGGLLKELNVVPIEPTVHDDDPPPKVDDKHKKKKRKKRSLRRKAKKKLNKCWKRFVIFVNSVKAMFARILYILHALLTVWRVTVLVGEWYWMVGSWLFFMVVEAGFVIFQRHGREWKWIQPCILIYLMVELPSIWMLELANLNKIQLERNMTNPIMAEILDKQRQSTVGNNTDVSVAGLTISDDWWALLLEQSMLVLIIIARWLMPKGDMTRDQLSGLLLFYLGTASDIVDFFSVINEDPDLSTTNYAFLFTIMTFWTWSIFQFIFLVTMTNNDDEDNEVGEKKDGEEEEHGEKTGSTENLAKTINDSKKKSLLKRESEDDEDKDLTFKDKAIKNFKIFLASEVWAILVSVIFQDGPYAIIRVTCLFYWNITTYTNYFFTFKNIMILILQIYRLIAVYQEHIKTKREERKKRKQERKKAWREAIAQATTHGHTDEHSALVTPVGAYNKGILRKRGVTKSSTTKTHIGGLTLSQSLQLQDCNSQSGFQIRDEEPSYRWSLKSHDIGNGNSDPGDLTEISVV